MAEELKKEIVCHCPYCDNVCKTIYPFCGTCGAPIKVFPECGEVLRKETVICTKCGQKGTHN